jgi:[ribosomal protein S5]-alanine N-acetyltransferase
MINSLFNDIDGDDIRLIKLSLDYLDDMWEYSSDNRMYEHFEFGPQKKLSDTKKYLNQLIERSNSVDAYWWFIQIKETGKVVGSFGVHNIDFRRHACEISYAVSPKYWGGGIFIKSLTAVLKTLIHNFNFHRITAVTSSSNVRSINALKKVGFKEEGVFRDFYHGEDGIRFDATPLSLLDSEYILVKN